jgi:hypothetical protein
MKKNTMSNKSSSELMTFYADISVRQDNVIFDRSNTRFNKLFREKSAIESELKSRAGDQRQVLLNLYDHPNMQVRLNAAKATLAIAPAAARDLLQAIHQSGWQPQAGDAGMCLWTLDEGIFKPE